VTEVMRREGTISVRTLSDGEEPSIYFQGSISSDHFFADKEFCDIRAMRERCSEIIDKSNFYAR
jgi:hypothetical protein